MHNDDKYNIKALLDELNEANNKIIMLKALNFKLKDEVDKAKEKKEDKK